MTTSSTSSTRVARTAGAAGPTSKQKVGLVLCGLYSVVNITSAMGPSPEGQSDGPPDAILVLCTLCGVVGLAATVMAWRGSAVAYRIAAGAIVIATLSAVPAFFVDVPLWLKAVVAGAVLVTVASVVLMFSSRRHTPVVD